MAKKTFNGRFELPEEPGKGTFWLLVGIGAVVFGTATSGIVGFVFAMGCFGAFGKRALEHRLYKHFLSFCTVIGMRECVSIKELAKVANISQDTARSELQKMLAKGYFGEGVRLDVQRDELWLPPVKGYEEPRRGSWKDVVFDLIDALRGDEPVQNAQYSYESPRRAQPEPRSAERPAPKPAPKPEPKPEPQSAPKPEPQANAASRTYIDELERTLNELYQLNEQIEDEGVSRRIDRIGALTGGIFRAVIEKPERAPEVRKFMNYYLPTTLKLLRSYDMLEDQSYQGENIVASRRKIEAVLDTLIGAYERQLDRLFTDAALDIATDIDVLETMMAGDGLSEKGRMPGVM